jgi:hypothetical protein
MRKTLTIIATALAAVVVLVPATAQARHGSHHKASKADRNRDRIPDSWERRHHLSLKVKQTKRDQDRDGLNNFGEFREKTNPRDRDSDNDGVRDGDENPGKIARFENGVLTITLTSGGSISAKVVDRTEIECRSATPTATTTRHDDDEDNSGPGRDGDDDHGDRENEAGDDHGDRENEAGDDRGRDNENEDEHEGNCSTTDLTPGTTVREAHIVLVGGSAVFREVELLK